MKSSPVTTFADDTTIFKTIVTQEDLSLLPADLRNISTWSFSVGLAFNESKCTVQRITRKLNPVIASYELNEHALKNSTAKKDQAVVISDNLSWDKQVCAVCFKSNRVLGFVRRNTRCINNVHVETIHLFNVTEVPSSVQNTSVGPSIDRFGFQDGADSATSFKIHPQSSISLSAII